MDNLFINIITLITLLFLLYYRILNIIFKSKSNYNYLNKLFIYNLKKNIFFSIEIIFFSIPIYLFFYILLFFF